MEMRCRTRGIQTQLPPTTISRPKTHGKKANVTYPRMAKPVVSATMEDDRFMRAILGAFEESPDGDMIPSEKLLLLLVLPAPAAAPAFWAKLLSEEVKGAGNLADFGVLPSDGEIGPLELTRRIDLELPRRPKELLCEPVCSLRLPDIMPIQSSSAVERQ